MISLANNSYRPEYSILNTGNKGLSEYYKTLNDLDLYDINRFTISPLYLESLTQDDVSEIMIIIVGSERQYTSSEVQLYNSFVRRGGTLLIYEDFGPARDIAKSMGITFVDGVLRETNPDFYTNSPDKPLVFDTYFSEILGVQINPIQLNRASMVWDPLGFQQSTAFPFLLSISPTAFYDRNDNNIVESTDFSGIIPLSVLKFIEDGLIAVVGDSSIPVNQHWGQLINIQGSYYTTGNAIYSIFLTVALASFNNITQIYFDESHKAISLLSATGITNWLFGSYIGIVTSLQTILITAILIFMVYILKSKKGKTVETTDVNSTGHIDQQFVSIPTRVERSISEQYILHQIMGKRYVHVVNSNLVNNLRNSGKAEDFLNDLEEKYGDIHKLKDYKTILEVNNLLKDYIERNTIRWL
jgi:hypothetical protein